MRRGGGRRTLCAVLFSAVIGLASAAGLETARWQAAVDAVAAKGGGRVVIPAGVHPVGQIELRSNVELHLERGAVLEGAAGMENYRSVALPYSEGDWSAVVAGFGVTNVAITGEGEINGRGERFTMDFRSAPKHVNPAGLRPRGVFFSDSNGIRLENFTLRDAACWGVVFKRCEKVVARRVKIDNHAHENNDGFDIEAKDVLIEDCDIDSGDDAICVKSNDPGYCVENVRVRRCVVRSHSNGMKLGTASHGTMRNIRFENCRAEAPRRDFKSRVPGKEGKWFFSENRTARLPAGMGISAICVECVDGGVVEDVNYDGIEVSGFRVPIFVRGGTRWKRGYCDVPLGDRRILRNITIRNVRGRAESAIPSSITGVDGCVPRDVLLENVSLVCRGDPKDVRPIAIPDQKYAGLYPEATMFRDIRLPACGLFVDRAERVKLVNVTFMPEAGTDDGRQKVFLAEGSVDSGCGGPECVDGIYPHLAMFNRESECGTGAVVPWAGSLWAVTYGPHCPTGSSDKLYQITPDLRQIVRDESVGGTPANRLVHRETNQLLIGPYVIDAGGKVRVVPPEKMPGRLTGAARHLTDSNKVYVATMETGLYELDMRTLAVNTLIRENGMNDQMVLERLKLAGEGLPSGWESAPRTHVAGYHAKGLASGFGKVFVSNNGENSAEARRNPFVPSGVLAWWNEPGSDWTQIRRCQFTEVTTKDGILGNLRPDSNPVWALGWDAKSVILAVTTNGTAWAYYRLPKASHCYDGAHGWNTEWPRIRDVGFDDGTLLATMHGTFWKFPKDFSPATPNGIRPLSTYLKVVGDFCRWQGRIVFGCDDQAQSEFLGKRALKKGAPKRDRSQSNLWFVRPEDLTTFGPPSGEGWVWLGEDVAAGAVSDPFLVAGYATKEFTFTDRDGRPVRHELLREGDWVRVRALEDAKGANAHFTLAPARPDVLPRLDARRPAIEITDDNGRTYSFPNVNGDASVLCREVVTERDLLYVGGVFYELPAENAGGFEVLRPIALADEPVRSIEAKLGLVYINGRPMALDRLWKNGTAAQAYWLWRDHWKRVRRDVAHPGVALDLVADGKAGTRAFADVPVGVGSFQNGVLAFDVEVTDPSVIDRFVCHVRSGRGWYRTTFEPTWDDDLLPNRTSRVTLPPSAFRATEGSPEGWPKADLVRFSAYRLSSNPSVVKISNIAFEPDGKAPVDKAARLAEIRPRLAAMPGKPGERRLAWCHSAWGMGDGHDWESTCRFLGENGFTDLLVNLAWGGCAYYPSRVLPRAEKGPRGDALAACQAACRRHGIKMHVWKVCWNQGSATPSSFTEAMTKAGRVCIDQDGKPLEKWNCPSDPENRQLEIDAMTELALEKGVDGIHFDYIRYGHQGLCHCDGCRARFEAEIGRKVEKWPQDTAKGGCLYDAWNRFRCGNITALVKAVAEKVKKARPETEISAAVFRNPDESGDSVGQDWVSWCRAGWLDFACPMNYFERPSRFAAAVRSQQEALKGLRTKLYPGLALSCSEYGDLGALAAAQEIVKVREAGLGGFTVFNLDKHAERILPELRKGPLKD